MAKLFAQTFFYLLQNRIKIILYHTCNQQYFGLLLINNHLILLYKLLFRSKVSRQINWPFYLVLLGYWGEAYSLKFFKPYWKSMDLKNLLTFTTCLVIVIGVTKLIYFWSILLFILTRKIFNFICCC